MSEIRNKIITISGEPRSGKSTVVKEIVKKYQQLGFKVHVIETGKIFRERSEQEYLKMYPDRTDINQADIQDDETFAKKRAEIDAAIDGWIAQLGEEINSKEKPNDVYIIDSRLAWHNIPSSFAVRLTVDETIAGQRALKDKSKGSQDSYVTVEEATEKTKQRKIGEIRRYKQRYGVDLTDIENYDLVADTSYSNTEELAQIIIDGEQAYREEKEYPKMWASPAIFLSEQRARSTYNEKVDKLVDIINHSGYEAVEGTLQIAENEGVKILLNGNHRVCAGLSTGKTLFPYEVIHKDDKESQRIANLIYDDPTLECVYDWADTLNYYGVIKGKIESFNKVFATKELIAVSKAPKLRKIFGLDKTKDEAKMEQDGEDR